MSPVLLFALQAMQAVPSILATASSLESAATAVKAHVDQTTAALQKMQAENRDPSAEEWAAQAASIASLRAQLHS